MKSLKAIWADPVWSAVIAGVILTAVTYSFGLWPDIYAFTISVWSFLGDSSKLPNWLIGFGIIACALVAFVFVAAAWQAIRQPEVGNIQLYVEDEFFGVRWRWKYDHGYICDLCSFCPSCDYQLFPRDTSAYAAAPCFQYECDSCHRKVASFEGDPEELYSKVKRFIQQKLRAVASVSEKNK